MPASTWTSRLPPRSISDPGMSAAAETPADGAGTGSGPPGRSDLTDPSGPSGSSRSTGPSGPSGPTGRRYLPDGADRPGGVRGVDEPDRSGQRDRSGRSHPDVRDGRSATVAELAAAIARIGPDGALFGVRAGSVARSRVGGAVHLDDGDTPPPGVFAGEPARVPPPDDPEGPAGDPAGDPEAVAKSICLRQLTGQTRSRAQLEQALRRREIPDDVAHRVLDRFTEVGLIDDAAYASAFVASKHRDRGLGRAALRTELRRKGVEGPAAEQALDGLGSDAERSRATELVAKRLDAAMFAGLPAARRRLLGLLARRGYPASLAASVVDDALRGFSEPGEAEPSDDALGDWDDVVD